MATKDQKWLNIPAIYVNQVTASLSPLGWRLTFSESPDGQTEGQQHRLAIYMPAEIGLNFKKLLDELVTKNVRGEQH